MRTTNISTAIDRIRHHGADVAYHQNRRGDSYNLEEAMLTPVLGMPITLLETDLAD